MKSTKKTTLNSQATVLRQKEITAQDYNDLKDDFDALRPNDTTVKTDTISEVTSGYGVTIDGVTLKDGGLSSLTTNVQQFTALATLTATEIVGSSAGDIGHAAGATLVAAPGAGYVNEFVSAVLIYDYDTAAYTGGADDIVIKDGDGGVSLSTVIAKADFLAAAGDKIVYIGALAATDQALTANKPITLCGTAFTQPGTAAGVVRAHVTYRVHKTNLA